MWGAEAARVARSGVAGAEEVESTAETDWVVSSSVAGAEEMVAAMLRSIRRP